MCSNSVSLDFLPVIHETDKVRVELLEDRVVKTFKPQPGAVRRFRRELRALRRLSGAEGFPRLLAFSEQERSITESRIPGIALTECDEIPESAYVSLRQAVETMLARGVARHAPPPRDILLLPNGQVAIVDFERTTFCWTRLCPIWRIASAITRFHLLRILGEKCPRLLTRTERGQLRTSFLVRTAFLQLCGCLGMERARIKKNRWAKPASTTSRKPTKTLWPQTRLTKGAVNMR